MLRQPSDWPERWRHSHADPTSALPGRGDRVKVLNGLDPHAGQVGRVRRVLWDAGDLLVTVRFSDGTQSQYWENELQMHCKLSD